MFKTITSSLDVKKKPSLDEIQKIPSFIFCRWLAGTPQTIFASNMINQYYDIPIECQYQMIKSAFAGKIRFIPYPKSSKENDSKDVEYISMYFNISIEKAREYLTLISNDELNTIKSLYQ